MTTEVVIVGPETEVSEVARLRLAHHISAVSVVEDGRRVIGMVSEAEPDASCRMRPPSSLVALLVLLTTPPSSSELMEPAPEK